MTKPAPAGLADESPCSRVTHISHIEPDPDEHTACRLDEGFPTGALQQGDRRGHLLREFDPEAFRQFPVAAVLEHGGQTHTASNDSGSTCPPSTTSVCPVI